MSLLLLGLDDDLGPPLIKLLVRQGDEVRALENDAARGERWRAFGAYIARGDETDADLIMRAATNCRTVVAMGDAAMGERLEAVVEGARLAGVERLVLAAAAIADASRARVLGAGIDFILLAFGRRRLLGGRAVAPEQLATAVDAADDLAGPAALDLDLRDDGAWEALGLGAPA